MRIQGLMTACIPAVEWAQLHSRDLQYFHLSSWDKRQESLDKMLTLPSHLKTALKWWTRPQNLRKGRSWGQWRPSVITTDASTWGWGAHLQGTHTQGTWDARVAKTLFNYRELRAVGEALRSFENLISGKEVQICSDYSPTVAYLNHQGGTRSETLLRTTQDILSWAQGRVISLSAIYIKGKDNWEADFLSRQAIRETEGKLNPGVFQMVVQNLDIQKYTCLPPARTEK